MQLQPDGDNIQINKGKKEKKKRKVWLLQESMRTVQCLVGLQALKKVSVKKLVTSMLIPEQR